MEKIIMLTITLEKNIIEYKAQIIALLEDNISELKLSIDYEVVEGDFSSVDYPNDEIFATRVFLALNSAIDEVID
jgi:hypothetical protein